MLYGEDPQHKGGVDLNKCGRHSSGDSIRQTPGRCRMLLVVSERIVSLTSGTHEKPNLRAAEVIQSLVVSLSACIGVSLDDWAVIPLTQ